MVGAKAKVRLVALLAAVMMLSLPLTAWAANTGALQTGSIAQVETQDASGAFVTQTVNMKTKRVDGRVIANGNYIIASAHNAQLLVGVEDDRRANRMTLRIREQGAKSQVWRFEYNKNSNTYIITNVYTGKALATNGTSVFQQKPVKPGSNGYLKQRWLISAYGSGYCITSAYNKKISLQAGANENCRVRIKKTNVSRDQRFWIFSAKNWRPEDVVKNGVYSIKNAAGNGMLQVKNASTAKNAIFQIGAKDNANLNQMYSISRVKYSYYKIVNVSSGKALTAVGDKVVQQKYTGKNTQRWVALLNDDGTVTFKNRTTQEVLGLAGSTFANHASARMKGYTEDPDITQRWVLSPTSTGMTTVQMRGFEKANEQSSDTNYTISVDLSAHKLMIFKRASAKAPWKLFKSWTISSGIHGSTNEYIGKKSQFRYTNPVDKGYSAYYWSRMGGKQYFHSIIYHAGTHNVMDGSLGRSVSSGCVRMSLENAKYIYYEIPYGTRVQRYY